jgi:hypothetical protein
MKSIKFDTDDGSMTLVNGDVEIITGKEAYKQNVISFLHIAKGEYFLNKDYGIDYFNTGYTTEDKKELFDAQVLFWLRKRPYITAIEGYKSSFEDGILTVTIEKIYTVEGDIIIGEVL